MTGSKRLAKQRFVRCAALFLRLTVSEQRRSATQMRFSMSPFPVVPSISARFRVLPAGPRNASNVLFRIADAASASVSTLPIFTFVFPGVPVPVEVVLLA
jgi:hypothetical protein